MTARGRSAARTHTTHESGEREPCRRTLGRHAAWAGRLWTAGGHTPRCARAAKTDATHQTQAARRERAAWLLLATACLCVACTLQLSQVNWFLPGDSSNYYFTTYRVQCVD